MAAIVNTRDLRLQATVPRIEQITLDANITVPSAQVDGLPEVIVGTKVVYLRATSEVFQIAKSGTITPANITLTASLRNMVSSAVWNVVSGTATLTTLGDGSKTLAYADMATDSVTITVSAIENNVTYSDTITIVKLREGTDTVSMILSNEAHTIPADSLGTAQTYTGAGTNVTIFVGTTDTTNSWTLSKVDSTGVTSSLANKQVSVTNMTNSATSGYIDITATRSGFPSITKRMSLTKTNAGTQGTNGTNGSNGQRGTVNLAVSGYASWSDTAATNAVINAGYIYPQNRDIVTLYDSSHSVSKFYNNGSWLQLDAYINGNMLVSGTLSAGQITTGTMVADRISGGTLRLASGNFQVVGTDNTIQIYNGNFTRCTASNGDVAGGMTSFTAGSSGSASAIQATGGTGPCLTFSGGGTGLYQSGSSINYLAAIFAASDNAYTLGGPSNRWNSLYVASGVVSTSDARTKTDVKKSDLGLDFIKSLNPVSYRQVVAENVVDYKVAEPVDVGPPAPDTQTITPRKGVRRHYGLIAQEVRKAMQNNGIDDAAFWIMDDPKDENSRQGLRYEELISPLIKAVQELSGIVEQQNTLISALMKKVSP